VLEQQGDGALEGHAFFNHGMSFLG